MKIKLQSVVTVEELFSLILRRLQEDESVLPIYPERQFQQSYQGENISYEWMPVQKSNASINAINVKKLIELHNENLSQEDTEAVCILESYTDICSDEALLSLLYAIVCKKRFYYVDDFEKLALLFKNDLQSIFVILPFSKMDFSFNYRISECNFIGFLPYINKHSILHYLFKKIAFDSQNKSNSVYLLLNRIQTKNDDSAQHIFKEGSAYYFPKGQCDLAHLENILTSSTNLVEFNYIAHSRECSVVMDDFLFCGYENISLHNINDAHRFLPSCYYDGNLCYTSNRKRFSTNELNAKMLFLNGCNIGDMDRSCIPYDYTVIKHLIDGNSVSIITSPSIKTGDVVENIFAHNLLKYGYSEGEKVYYLNRFLITTGLENNLYYQIGDPSTSYGSLQPISIELDLNEQNETEIQITGIKGETFLEVRLKNHCESRNIHIKQCKIQHEDGKIDNKSVIYYFISDSLINNEKVCMFFSKEPIESSSMSIVFTFKDPIESNLNLVQEYNLNMEFLKGISKIPSHVKGRLEDLQNQYTSIQQVPKDYRYNIKSRTKLLTILYNLEKKYKKLGKELFYTIKAYTEKHSDSFFESVSEKRREIERIQFISTCKECGDVTGEFSYSLFTNIGAVWRKSFKCMQCGGISDVADNNIHFYGRREIRLDLDGWNDVIYTIENRNETPIELTTAVICIDSEEWEIELEQEEFEINPFQKIDFKVKIKPKALLKKGYYLFSFYFMANTKFYYTSKMIGYVNSITKTI